MTSLDEVKKIMAEFAESTGLLKPEVPVKRYLWTDSFAVCNFLGLYRQLGDENWLESALHLVDQVHRTLGRHRKDDGRTGWISGLSEKEGRRHPTVGGLRIGKSLNERAPDEPEDDRLEWDRDGQYYHYLTKWMHALNRVSQVTKDGIYNWWAMELAKASHRAFVYDVDGSKRMYWKMSIDLSRPLVRIMGQHDSLDGLLTYKQLEKTAEAIPPEVSPPDLATEIRDLEPLCKRLRWTTEDPLGIGGLLTDVYRASQLMAGDSDMQSDFVMDLVEASRAGLEAYMARASHKLPAEYRLAFRELGLSIGLHAVAEAGALVTKKGDRFPARAALQSRIGEFASYRAVGQSIEAFWLEPENRNARTWTEHKEINSVMLATSLAPDGYLKW